MNNMFKMRNIRTVYTKKLNQERVQDKEQGKTDIYRNIHFMDPNEIYTVRSPKLDLSNEKQ